MTKILIVEDHEQIAEGVRAYLVNEGYEAIVARDGEEGLRLAREQSPDLVVLDLMLPKVDGLEVCRRIRTSSRVPIIMLTAKVEETDKLIGLEVGADDYVTKPFSVRELTARIRAVLRRTAEPVERPSRVEAGPVAIDLDGHKVIVAGAELVLTRSEFLILALLAAHPGRVYTRERLVEELHGEAFGAYERTVDMHVANLRKKLRAATEAPLVHTVIGVGYKFEVKNDAP